MSSRQEDPGVAVQTRVAQEEQQHDSRATSKTAPSRATIDTLSQQRPGSPLPSSGSGRRDEEENLAVHCCSLGTSPGPEHNNGVFVPKQRSQLSQPATDSPGANQRQINRDLATSLDDSSGQIKCGQQSELNNNNGSHQVESTIDKRKMHMGIIRANTQTGEGSSWDVSCANGPSGVGQPGLLYYNREPLGLKDFRTEVRARMDVEQFSHQAELLLDLNEVSMEGIVDAMLEKVAQNDRIEANMLAQIREAIFIPGSSLLMARTIQGFYSVAECHEWDRHHETGPSGCGTATGGATPAILRHDQSWLCALCNLAQVSKRHMVVARFKQPTNMGENAREVRLFVLIIVPTKEKSTKDQVETGRTFATMLTDAHFRQRLLHARGQTEFKALMMAKAQQLARCHRLKSRHKYLLDPILHESISSASLDVEQQQPQLLLWQHPGHSRKSSPMHDDGSSIESALPIRVNGRPMGGRDSAIRDDHAIGDGALGRFMRNPRTSKLFQLISESSPQTPSEKNNNSTQTEFVSLDKLKAVQKAATSYSQFRPAAKGEGARRGGCCAFLGQLEFGKDAWRDFTGRLRYYPSDFRDAVVGPPRTIQKTVATIWFLYFGILLPTIAFSSLNTVQTHGHMGDLRKAIIGQAIGGLGFAFFGGQPLVIIMTTAPLCLYTKVIHQMCLDYGFAFPAMYAAVGLWNGLFLTIYSLFGFSKLMRWCTRSTEEIFAMFIVVAFVTDACKDMMTNFRRFYFTPACEAQNNQTTNVLIDGNQTMGMTNVMASPSDHSVGVITAGNISNHAYRDIEDEIEISVCRRETSLLFVLLMLGTLWLAVTLYKFRRTPYLSTGKRDILADYALPTAVILMSLVGSTLFDNIYVEKFPPLVDIHFERARLESLPWSGLVTSMGLGFTLSLLFFMDQNISAAMVMAPQNKLKKGSAYHYDLLIVGVLNGVLSLYGLPMMHGVLPHSPLHVRSLADIEEQVEEGHLREVVVNCRETRVTGIVAHVLVLLSLLLIPYPIAYIPRAVLNGLFLYMAVTSLDGLHIFERILLLVTEQNKYPPNHYIRRCPQRKIHQFTLLQLAQLAVMCLFGFSPVNIVEMFFPVFILLMIPFRHKIVPKYIDERYLDALDGKH